MWHIPYIVSASIGILRKKFVTNRYMTLYFYTFSVWAHNAEFATHFASALSVVLYPLLHTDLHCQCVDSEYWRYQLYQWFYIHYSTLICTANVWTLNTEDISFISGSMSIIPHCTTALPMRGLWVLKIPALSVVLYIHHSTLYFCTANVWALSTEDTSFPNCFMFSALGSPPYSCMLWGLLEIIILGDICIIKLPNTFA